MALDGIFLGLLGKEIENIAVGAKVNQVQQPARDELVFTLHTKEGNKRLLISARADSPRVSFTDYAPENPKEPPMFCMFLRKHLCSARLKGVRQHEAERILFFDFDAINSVGDRRKLTLVAEIMGKHSNCILLDAEGVILDALKRIDMTLSSKRMVLPQLPYELPPSQGKMSLFDVPAQVIVHRITEEKTKTLDKAILNTVMGISPIVARELSFSVDKSGDKAVTDLDENDIEKLKTEIDKLREIALGNKGIPTLIKNAEGKPFDLTFIPVNQYGNTLEQRQFTSYCELLDEYYRSRDTIERMKAHSRDLTKLVVNAIGRLTRKINAQKAELEATKDRESLRIRGDLLQANLYRTEKGASYIDVENFYDENYATLRIPLDPSKSPSQNAQKFYRDYARAKTADKILRVQIEKAQSELLYLESVLDEIERAQTQKDMQLIRAELMDSGYIKMQKGKQKPPQELPPKEYRTSGGFTVLVGRNNRQNDKLTLKLSHKEDIWLHTKDIPSSHTVIVTQGREVPETDILEAARFCAYHSKARESSQVPVDYTKIRYVSKPSDAPIGRVIYTHQKTVFVTPENPEKFST
ncbi:MAG: NFACT RNA binding domain-containing protein [Eubacteriales bacterium]|nr:NFACT RNA binding domain-containing protein [Eubacteriales bacterium]